MKISPKDTRNAICPSCGINMSDPSLMFEQTMYRITAVSGKRISYITASVDVPKCRHCRNNYLSAMVFPIVLSIILTIVLIYSCANGGMSVGTFLLSELLVIVVSLSSWWVSIQGTEVMYGTKGLSKYKPIQIMEQHGWQPTKPQRTSEFKRAYTNVAHCNMIMEICHGGEYVIKEDIMKR